MRQERQVEAVQIVIFDHVGVERGDPFEEAPDERRFVFGAIARSFEAFRVAVRAAQGDEEDSIDAGIESCRLEIELGAPQIVEGESVKVGAPALDQILRFRWKHESRGVAALAYVRYGA